MEEMQTLSKITYSNRYGQLYTETSPIQRKIMESFNLSLPTSLHFSENQDEKVIQNSDQKAKKNILFFRF